MVSFSCDACQNVFTKPRIERHMGSCHTSSVSCIDCGIVFTHATIRGHTSCITEAEKYGDKKASKQCTRNRCGLCDINLNGAVHAEQHYNSKKHRAQERKQKQQQISEEKKKKEETKAQEVEQEKILVQTENNDIGEEKLKDENRKDDENLKKLKLKKRIKKVLRTTAKGKMKKEKVVDALGRILGEGAPDKDVLSLLIEKEVGKSKQLEVKKGRIKLVEC